MIFTQNLCFEYQAGSAFSFPDITCPARETLLITGVSGVGKTTLLHLLSGIMSPSSGDITVGDKNITRMSERARDRFRGRHIGLVFQKSYFAGALTVLENLTLASWLATGEKRTDHAKALLNRLGLEEVQHQLPSRLSTGQQQRVSIARALMNDPKVLLADEPTSSLDDDNCKIVANILKEQSSATGAALLIVTHDLRLKNLFTNIIELI